MKYREKEERCLHLFFLVQEKLFAEEYDNLGKFSTRFHLQKININTHPLIYIHNLTYSLSLVTSYYFVYLAHYTLENNKCTDKDIASSRQVLNPR